MSSEASGYPKPQLMLGLAGVAAFSAYTEIKKGRIIGDHREGIQERR